jgi:hypothetical protein
LKRVHAFTATFALELRVLRTVHSRLFQQWVAAHDTYRFNAPVSPYFNFY